jgi:hypothetical protein
VAGRVVFQADQAEPQDQILCGHHRECCYYLVHNIVYMFRNEEISQFDSVALQFS